ncbi:MAG: Uma2 family endonuclease [Bacteroidia bacterium]|nr:Uma2 family endonuclease [Bacteroidia bacterium]
MAITSLSQLDPNGTYSYADYLRWEFEERVELLRGKIRQMAAPNRRHQTVSRKIQHFLSNALWKSSCELYAAPFDVRLTRMRDDKAVSTVVQPDLCVICDRSKLDERGCNGAPDLIVEILSPGNSRTEMRDKFELYQEAGVLEYWIVSPDHRTIQVWRLNEQGCYLALPPAVEGDLLGTPIVPNLALNVTEVFED